MVGISESHTGKESSRQREFDINNFKTTHIASHFIRELIKWENIKANRQERRKTER